MVDYTKEEINEAVSGEKQQFTNLKNRILKWDLILNEIHENLKFLHEEFNIIYEALNKLGDANEHS